MKIKSTAPPSLNRIEAVMAHSLHSPEHQHLCIYVDGKPLDQMLQCLDPKGKFEGLVPTLLPWLSNSLEKAVVWGRILPEEGGSLMAPVLMCGDDCDFSCFLVIACVRLQDGVVRWTQIGAKREHEWSDPESVGRQVDWVPGFQPLSFDLEEYKTMLHKFRLEVARAEFLDGIWQWLQRIGGGTLQKYPDQSYLFELMQMKTAWALQLSFRPGPKTNLAFHPKEPFHQLGSFAESLEHDAALDLVFEALQGFIESGVFAYSFLHAASSIHLKGTDGKAISLL